MVGTEVERDHRAKRILRLRRGRGRPSKGGALQRPPGRLRRQVLLRRELLVKPALGQAGPLHQILKADTVKAALPKKATCHIDYGLAVFRSLNATDSHEFLHPFRLHSKSISDIEFERNLI